MKSILQIEKVPILKIAKLLSGGIISSICLIVISSEKTSFLNFENSQFLILYIQWELWGVVISKVGLDQINLALVIENKNNCLDYFYFIKKNIWILGIFIIASFFFTSFSISILIVLFLTIIFDLYSVLNVTTHIGLKNDI